ncbi:hypothetical protein LAZ67_X004559 [Cordylochernes scorpioides]|uniref:Reverse transcriptase domain-containing protein n=1 Tax=Cordylochernes scorpioides TaxID=51811 RepID=A0ABY6LVD2_9ARAC|nr:hypothetical protein LAZ67_X004559 [Cordylochernes scorpioides]
MRQEKLKEFKLGMKKQQFMFTKVSQESEAAVHASYVLSEMIAKHSKPFTEGDFIKEYLIKAAEIVCPGSVKTFQAISLSRNTVVERVADMARNLNDQIKEKSSCFKAFSIACDESNKNGNVVTPIKKFINFIRSRGLNQRQFSLFLTELESEYSGLSYYTEVRWLSCSKVLKQFWDLKEEICQFLITKNQDITLFSDQVWLQDFSFMVDITKHLSDLNLKLQGKDQIITNMCDQVNAFKCKLVLWEKQLKNEDLMHFPTCNMYKSSLGETASYQKYAEKILSLRNEFETRFSDFKSLEGKFTLFSSIFSINIESVPNHMQMEVIDIQCDSDLKAKFIEVGVSEFYKYLPARFENTRKLAYEIISMFGSTYRCEQLFSLMKGNKSPIRSRITDVHLGQDTLGDDGVPIDDTTTKPLFTPQEKGRKGTRDKVPRLRWNPWQKHARSMSGSLQILLDFKVDDQLYSDHHPLVLTIKGQNFNEKKTKREDYNITRYRWSADGLAMFKMKLEELREKNIPASDDLVYTFNQRILEAMSSAKITYSIKGGPRKSKPWFDKDCYDMKKLAKESLKKYRKTNRLEDRECYASSRKKYLALLDLKRKGFDNEKQEILRNAKDSKTFWKTIALYKSTSIIQGEISIQDWLNFYRELMTTEKNLRICNLHNVISQSDPILDSEITNADIYKEIAGLRSNKACGPDGIPNEVLKTLPDSYILLLKQLYNSVMTTGKYPAIWTNSTIHPIFKNGYKNSPSNYRGIALISNVSKLFTSILRSRLEEWVEGRRVIPENQAGFRKGRSCIDHIFTLTTLIQLSLRKKRGKLYVFFVDLRKAFDTVPHSILWKKLYNLGISYQFISTIRSYYEQATIAIRWKGSFTESIKINSGVLQGEPLSPLLFILFITDLIEIYNNSDLPSVNLPEFGDIHLLLYADDIAIIGESRMNLQKKIKILKEYLDENLMTLNESKSKIMVFRNGGKPSNKDRWFWNDKPITITSRYTYLGFPLTPTITTTHPANYFKGKALTAINATYPILIKSKAKSINLSIKLFDTIVRAVLMYAAPLWATEHKDLLDNIQDIFICRFLNLPRYTPGYLIRLETGRISLSVTALKLTLKYWLRVLNMSSDRLPRVCFNRTRELSNSSGTPIGFIKKLTNLLNNNGSPALVSCDDPETLRSAITGLLKTAADQSIQNDLTRMDKSKLCSYYKDIHLSFMTEGYLLGDFPFPVVRLLAQSKKENKTICDPRDKLAYITARRESQKLTREHDNTSWDYFFENLKVTDQTIWKAIKFLSNSEKQDMTLKTNIGQTIEEAAESFANNYEKQLNPNQKMLVYNLDVEEESSWGCGCFRFFRRLLGCNTMSEPRVEPSTAGPESEEDKDPEPILEELNVASLAQR